MFDTEVAKFFAQIAGIGGISLFVFLYLFREVIRKKIFPQLSHDNAYKIIRLFLVLVFLLGMSGLAAWYYGIKPVDPTPVVVPPGKVGESIAKWFVSIDNAHYEEAWKSMPEFFQEHTTKKEFVEIFESQRKPKGKVVSRNPYGSSSLFNPNGFPGGAYEVRTFITQFEDGSKHIEKVILNGTTNGWKVISHELLPTIN